MKSKYLSSVAGVTLISVLGAAGAAQAQVPNWTGAYVGVYAGGAWGNSDAVTTSSCPTTFGYYCITNVTTNAAAVNATGTGTVHGSAFIGGIEAGYNWQVNNFVYGIEGDYGFFNLNGSRTASGTYPLAFNPLITGDTYNVTTTFDTNWLFTFRGRVGWAVNNLLVYFTGGGAVTKLAVTQAFNDSLVSESAQASKQLLGWTVGGGLEWMMNSHWTIKAEYLYVDFSDVIAGGPIRFGSYSGGISTSSDLTAHNARLGVNFKF